MSSPLESAPLVVFISPVWPTYRGPLIRRLRQLINCAFWGTTVDPMGSGVQGLDASDTPLDRLVTNLPLVGGLFWQRSVLRPGLASRRGTRFVITGDARCLTYWILAPLLRLGGKRVYFWTHGWTRQDSIATHLLKKLFFNLASGLLTYTPQGKELGIAAGFRPDRMHVVYNSMQEPPNDPTFSAIGSNNGAQHWLVLSRLIGSRRIDEILRQMIRMRASGRHVRLTVVGDGPQRAALEEFARSAHLDVHFIGATYDETETERLVRAADVLVSPGHVGLGAVHALMHGCPVSTHDSSERQMPEHIAVRDGVTGVRWPYGDYVAMADATWSFVASYDREMVAAECFREVAARWTPMRQAEAIISAVC